MLLDLSDSCSRRLATHLFDRQGIFHNLPLVFHFNFQRHTISLKYSKCAGNSVLIFRYVILYCSISYSYRRPLFDFSTLEKMFPPFPEGRSFCRTKQFLSDENTTCSVRLNRESTYRRIAARRLRRAGSFEVPFFLCLIPTVQKYSVLIRCKAVACLTCNDS